MPASRPPPPTGRMCRRPCAAGYTMCFSNLGGPVDRRQRSSRGAIRECRRSRWAASWSIPPSAWPGIFDVATDWGMPGRDRDFGETLGAYGVPTRAPIWYCPCAARPTVRDFAGNYLDGYFSPLHFVQLRRQPVCRLDQVHTRLDGQPLRKHRHLSRTSSGPAWTITPRCGTHYLRAPRPARSRTRTVRTAGLPDF